MPPGRERLVAGFAVAAIGVCALGLCGMADLSGGGGGGDTARRGELRARSGDCRDQPRPGRADCDRRAARAQRPLCLARQRRRRGADGRLRLFPVEPFGVSRHLHAGDPDLAGAGAHPRARNRCRAGARRGGARGARRRSHQRLQPAAPASAADLRRQRAAAATRQRRDAAVDGGRGDDPFEPVGAGADRRLHHRAAGDRGADLAVGRAQGAAMGTAAAAAAADSPRWRSAACCLPP